MKQVIVNAFTDQGLLGNPAAVCVKKSFPSDRVMTRIAIMNQLSETAFVVKDGQDYHLRWFTPGGEIDLCGHATLATAFVIFTKLEPEATSLRFLTKSGPLIVKKKGELLEMDFPAYDLKPVPVTQAMIDALGVPIQEAYLGRDLLCIVENENQVKTLKPNLGKVKALDGLLCHVSAIGSDFDCVSRSFAPKLAIDEDPVCGSGHCHIVPYWSKVLRKKTIKAYQASERGGVLICEDHGDRISLAGKASIAKPEIVVSEIEVPVIDNELTKLRIGQPAARALASHGLTTLVDLVHYTESELLSMHGVGPKALRILKEELALKNLSLRNIE